MVSRMPRSSGSSCAVKLNSLLFQAGDVEHFRHVAMMEDRVRREVFGDLAEAGLQAGLASRAADAGLGVADNAGGAVDDAGFQQGTKGEVGGGGVAARVRNQARGGDPLAAELGQPVDGLGQQLGLGVGFLVPGGVVLGRAQAEGAAQIDHASSGRQHQGRELHGDFRGSGQEDDSKLLLAYGVGGTGDARAASAGGEWQARRRGLPGGPSGQLRSVCVGPVCGSTPPRCSRDNRRFLTLFMYKYSL